MRCFLCAQRTAVEKIHVRNVKYNIMILLIFLPGRGSESAGCYAVEMTGMDAILAAIQTMYQVVPLGCTNQISQIHPTLSFINF